MLIQRSTMLILSQSLLLLSILGPGPRADEMADSFYARVREFLSSVPSVPGVPITYDVTAACLYRQSGAGMAGLCEPQTPKCIRPRNCVIADNDWSWPLPQDERDFVATFMAGRVFRFEQGVCDLQNRSYSISWVPQQTGGRQQERIDATIDKVIPVCCEGFQPTEDFRCLPVCNPACRNGECIQPNTCRCNAGFVSIDDPNNCQLLCPNGCKGDDRRVSIPCTSYNNCTCPPGYFRDGVNWQCSPICLQGCRDSISCSTPPYCKCLEREHWATHRDCSVPIVCQCPVGFTMNANNQCEPVMLLFCNGINSTNCRPDMHCYCDQDFKPNYDRTHCEPKSQENCLDTSNCRRKICTCPPGFTLSRDETICESTSPATCYDVKCSTNAQCTCPPYSSPSPADNNTMCVYSQQMNGQPYKVPINCECPTDFSHHPRNTSRCVSYSAIACNKQKILKCRGRHNCTCPKRYVRTLDGTQCLPPCHKGGPSLFCNPPDFCICPTGYYCSNGSTECLPFCSKGCSHGYCSKAEHCTCDKGYKNDKHGQCVPHCEPQCQNAKCTAPNVCTCLRGYKVHPLQDHICKPQCSSGCPNGRCVAPEKCECKDEFYKDKYGDCVPMCPLGCNYGKCTGINRCTCLSGYEPVPGDSHSCIPACHPACINGQCVSPNNCVCNSGYREDPHNPSNCISNHGYYCSPGCVNGNCTAYNHCTCFSGYQNDPQMPHMCHPMCDPPCVNAVCSSQNMCICNQGFRKDPTAPTRNICVPRW